MAAGRPATRTSSSQSGLPERIIGRAYEVNPHLPEHGPDGANHVESGAPRGSGDARHERLLALTRGAVWGLELDRPPRLDDPPARIADAILGHARITESNASFASRFPAVLDGPTGGVAPGDLTGFWLCEDRRRVEELARAGLECRALSVTELDADGVTRILSVDMSPIVEDGHVHGLLAIERDMSPAEEGRAVTEASPGGVLADRTEQERQEALAHVSRLSTLGEMASGIAHEFNQPLAAIVNYANGCMRLLEQRGVDDQMVFRALGSIVDQGQRASGIIRRLRSFARREEDDREPLRLSSIVEESIQLISQPRRRAKVQITADFASADDMVVANGVQIQQVVINLLLNAIEALGALDGDRERRIRVSTRIAGDPGSSSGVRALESLAAERTQAYVEAIVEDNGPGVSDEVSQRLFDPFYSASGRGLGLGLPIGRSIIESHGGRLWLSAPEDGSSDPPGARFHFTLPVRRGQISS